MILDYLISLVACVLLQFTTAILNVNGNIAPAWPWNSINFACEWALLYSANGTEPALIQQTNKRTNTQMNWEKNLANSASKPSRVKCNWPAIYIQFITFNDIVVVVALMRENRGAIATANWQANGVLTLQPLALLSPFVSYRCLCVCIETLIWARARSVGLCNGTRSFICMQWQWKQLWSMQISIDKQICLCLLCNSAHITRSRYLWVCRAIARSFALKIYGTQSVTQFPLANWASKIYNNNNTKVTYLICSMIMILINIIQII